MRWQASSALRLAQQAGASVSRGPLGEQPHRWTACLLGAGQYSPAAWQEPSCLLDARRHSALFSASALPSRPPPQPQPAVSLHSFQPQRGFFNLPGSTSPDLSKHYRERRLIGYSPEQLYQVVAKVEDYKEFVPWCERSTVLERKGDNYMEAELEVGFRIFVERYTSVVHLEKNKLVLTKVADSTLFNSLDNRWEFEPGPTANSCWLTFKIDFAFKSPLYGQLATVFFKEVVQRMMGAFEGRCKQQFGPSSFDAKKGFQRTRPVSA